ncbi:MAG: sulfatase-like hydrolase/transferase, partial [Planctomycetes bacterium]|nr:sulfatase-like hydrolase/transferase [Planctomycetota bacterium]
MIASMDESVGVIMEKISKLDDDPTDQATIDNNYKAFHDYHQDLTPGELAYDADFPETFIVPDNTYIIFLSDNGGCEYEFHEATDNHPLKDGKGSLYEGGIRVPLIIAGPKENIAQGQTCNIPVNSCDILPTLVNLADGATVYHPKNYPGFDGASMVPLLNNPSQIIQPGVENNQFARVPTLGVDTTDPIFGHHPFPGDDSTTYVQKRFNGEDYKLLKRYDNNYTWNSDPDQSDFNHQTMQLKYNVGGSYELYNLSSDGGKFDGAIELFGKDHIESSYPGITGNSPRTVSLWFKLQNSDI